MDRDLTDIIRSLSKMQEVNYDQNKIDYLFELLEMSFENEPLVNIIVDRLKAIERIHKESPNIEESIKNLTEKQKLIDLSFQAEDMQITKTKKTFLESMWDVQKDLKEVTMLHKNLSWYSIRSNQYFTNVQ